MYCRYFIPGNTYTAENLIIQIFKQYDINGIHIEKTQNISANFYDHQKRSISIASELADSISLYALAIGTHEAVHAVLHSKLDSTFKGSEIREFILKIIVILLLPLLIISVFFLSSVLIMITSLLFFIIVVINLFTLRNERKVNKIAHEIIEKSIELSSTDSDVLKKVLSALTQSYVFNVFGIILQPLLSKSTFEPQTKQQNR